MLIGLTGYAQHGKDTIANLLVEEYGFRRYAFADKLKQMALVLNPIVGTEFGMRDDKPWLNEMRLKDLHHDHGWEAIKTMPEVRRFLQVLGTDAVRDHLGTNSWVDALFRQWVNDCNEEKRNIDAVISDVRFPNEADACLADSVELWRVVRVNADDSPFDNGIGIEHPSEKYVASLPVNRVLTAANVGELQGIVRGVMSHVHDVKTQERRVMEHVREA